MNVLVACEYSGVVRDAFYRRGHNAWSCDLLPSESNVGPHREGDVFSLLGPSFGWDLIIAHPPCTALTVAGNRHYGEGQPQYQERLDAVQWTRALWDRMIATAPKVCLENPVGVLRRMAGLPKPQYIQPYQFGHMEQKKTALYLHNLPNLRETDNVYDEMMKLPKRERERIHYMAPRPDRGKLRSRFFEGIAEAMADQWGELA